MDLLLWRWSTAVQATSLVMITVFFGVLARSVPLAAVRWWVRAWACNLAALGVTLCFWYFEPPAITFSVGLSRLAPGGQPDEAVRAADESMYVAKAERLRRPAAAGRRN